MRLNKVKNRFILFLHSFHTNSYQFHTLCRTIDNINNTHFISLSMNCKCFQITCKSFFPFTSNTHPYSNIAIHCLQSSRLPILQNEIIQITSFDTTSPSLSQTSFQLSIHLIHTITNQFNTLTKSSFLCLLYSLNKHFYRNG